MNSKERVYTALAHREPDRVPRGENKFDNIFFRGVMGYDTLAYAGWEEMEALWAGRRDEIIADYIDALPALAEALKWDYIRVPPAPKAQCYAGCRRISERVYENAAGRRFNFNPAVGTVSMPEKFNTEMDISELGDPEAEFTVDDSELDILRGIVARVGGEKFIVAHSPYGGTFPWMGTVGLEEYLIRFITDPEFCHRAAEIACRKCIAYATAAIGAGADAVMISEDWGDNKGLTMGKARFHEFILPYFRRIVDAVHACGGKLIKHSDGVMWDALDTFAEVGVDGWHGIQPSIGMYPEKLKERYGGQFCFFGGVNVETIIAGTPDDVRREVRRMIKYCAPGGGLVMACGNILEPDTKPENVFAMRDEIDRIGNYPIDADAIEV